jgi:hypothetical protein
MRVRVLLLGALLLGALVGCTSSSATSTPTTATVTITLPDMPGSSSPATSTATAKAGPTTDVSAQAMAAFASPSGNIGCLIGAQTGGIGVRCDLANNTWTVPAKPADCQLDWGHSVFLNPQGASLGCVGDTVLGEAAVGSSGAWWNGQPGSQVVTVAGRGQLVGLAYGATLTSGTVACTSQTDGMHCTDSASKHGFDISRESFTLR